MSTYQLNLTRHLCCCRFFLHVAFISTLSTRPSQAVSLLKANLLLAPLSAHLGTKHRYQLNPDRIKDEVITNALVKSMTCFPSPQFSLCLHLIPPSLVSPPAADGSDGAAAATVGELPEALGKLRALNDQLQGAQYARFWATLDSDDLYADLTADVAGFEEMIRVRIATLVGHAYREVDLPLLESWLGLEGQAAAKFITETAAWAIDGAVVKVPRNPENEARKAEIREDVNVDMFSRVIRRAWEETA